MVRGWDSSCAGLDTFVEAPLLESDLYGECNPDKASILLVSAPGAVGKSTLARQVAYNTGAVYVDLAVADPVGGNTISGGLAKSKIYNNWEEQETTLLVDGLDEARLRVPQESFVSFLEDIVVLSRGRSVPVVLFGRTGAIQDAWIVLNDLSVEVAVLEIGYFDRQMSFDFAISKLKNICTEERPFYEADNRAVALLLDKLREQTEGEGDRFAGYAPVLQAVAERVVRESNPASLIARIDKGEEGVSLLSVARAILERDRSKLMSLNFEDKELKNVLYSPEEQLDRLVARVYGVPGPNLPPMSPHDAQIYESALNVWVGEHPFLKETNNCSSAVFRAMVCVHALNDAATAPVVLDQELGKGSKANPFLSEFYLSQGQGQGVAFLPSEHVGIVYASLRAGLAIGDSAALNIDVPDDFDDENDLRSEVEIELTRQGSDRPRMLCFDSDQTGVIRLGSHVEDVVISVPYSVVQIGSGDEASLVSPVNIQCAVIEVNASSLIVERHFSQEAAAVYLESEEPCLNTLASVPVLRGGVSFSVSWPGAKKHPWSAFATQPTPGVNPQLDEALRRLRKFVVIFRSHSRPRLGKCRDKIEDTKMTKGTGQAVLNLLRSENILSLEGHMYYLDPAKLGEVAGVSYFDCMSKKFNQKVVGFVSKIFQ